VDYEITRKIFAIVQARPKALAGQRGSRNKMRPKEGEKKQQKATKRIKQRD